MNGRSVVTLPIIIDASATSKKKKTILEKVNTAIGLGWCLGREIGGLPMHR